MKLNNYTSFINESKINLNDISKEEKKVHIECIEDCLCEFLDEYRFKEVTSFGYIFKAYKSVFMRGYEEKFISINSIKEIDKNTQKFLSNKSNIICIGYSVYLYYKADSGYGGPTKLGMIWDNNFNNSIKEATSKIDRMNKGIKVRNTSGIDKDSLGIEIIVEII